MQGPKQQLVSVCDAHHWPSDSTDLPAWPIHPRECVFCLVEELKRDRDIWKRLNQKTISLDSLKAQFVEDMLKDAVALVEAMEQGPLQEAAEFVSLYKMTWGKKDE